MAHTGRHVDVRDLFPRLRTYMRSGMHARATMCDMRTTIEFDDDAAKAVARLRRERGIGVSQAVNELIRRGLVRKEPVSPFRQTTRKAGLKIDVSNVAEALDLLEGGHSR